MSATDLVVAVRAGDIGEVKRLLTADPSLARARVEQRTMLHHATDWPGDPPNVATVIRSLVEAGADVHATCPHPDNPLVAETPLHWAASSNDLDAIAALLDAGADVDAVGGIFDGCTPLVEAVVFENYEAAAMLLERGATSYLPAEAALGRLEEVRAPLTGLFS